MTEYVLGFLGKLVPSLLWLLYRCYQVLSTPVDELVQELRIDIPFTPTVCLDSVSETSVVLHWDIQIKRDENLYFLLIVNGHEAARLSGTSCKIDSLLPGKLYRINIVAVNSLTNFRSQLRSTFIRTIEAQNSRLKSVLQDCDATKDIEKFTEATNNGDLALSSAKDLPTDISVSEVAKCIDVEVLHYYLHKYQHELIKTNLEMKSFEEKSRKELETLKDQEKFFKSELDTESDNRAKKDNDVKSYEHKKADLAFMKSKLTAQVKQLESSNDIIKGRISSLQSDIDIKKKRNDTALKSKDDELSWMNDRIKELKSNNIIVRKQNDVIENSLKSLKIKRKELSKLLDQLKPVVEAFQNEFVTNRDGPISRNAIELLVEINKIAGPEWEREINNEVNTYEQFEMDWKSTYRFEIRKYISLQHSFEIAKLNKDKSYQPQKMTEYQASIEFGGYQNALISRPQNNQFLPHNSNSLVNIVQGSATTGSTPTNTSTKFKKHHNNHYYSRDSTAAYSSGSSNSNIPTPEFMSNSTSQVLLQQQQQQQPPPPSLQTLDSAPQITMGSGGVPLVTSTSSIQTNNTPLDSNYNVNALANGDGNINSIRYNDFEFYYPEGTNATLLQSQTQNSNPPQLYNVSSPSNDNRYNFVSHYQDIYFGDTHNVIPTSGVPNNQVITGPPMMLNSGPSLDYLLTNNTSNLMLNFEDSSGSFKFENYNNTNAPGNATAPLTGGIGQLEPPTDLIGSPLPDMMQLNNSSVSSTLLPNVSLNNTGGGGGGIVSTTPLLGMSTFNDRIGTMNVSSGGTGPVATSLGGTSSNVSNFNSATTSGGTYSSPFWNSMQTGSNIAQPTSYNHLGTYAQSPDFLKNFNDSDAFGRGLNRLSPSPITVNNLGGGLTSANNSGGGTVATPTMPATGIFFGNSTPNSGTIHSNASGSNVNDLHDDTDNINHGTPTTTTTVLPPVQVQGQGLPSSAGANGGLLWDYGLGYHHRRNVSNGPIWRNDNLSVSSFNMSGGPVASAPSAIGTRSRSNTFNATNSDSESLVNRPTSSTLY
ncbi:uncharacterized protein KQ657_000641 [Scheffersomyces spartinae]|uniref:Fibronectin type-III domain-containing protein n=1 Tax=Scheffersomyces spartinae TaxID=45513 RepID=A0A9P8AHP2_9ASCO|nr:uncharacterized protein KQ657_000641 [Scheffersomyces spartinae]KAG7193572.1 hypothetical protein KQ657_000641 [Scheffersomyces spartinae]